MKRFVKMIALCMMLSLVVTLLCAPVGALESAQTHITSTGSAGEGVGTRTTLIDFTASDLFGFEALGNTSEPTFKDSATWQAPVLFAFLDPSEPETGIRGTLETASPLTDANTLSIQLLAQYKETKTDYNVTLFLEAADKNGAPLSLAATATVAVTNWQTVTFDISTFVAEVDPNAPVTLKILTSSPIEESEVFAFWVCSIYTSKIDSYPEFILPTAAAAVGFLFGFTLFFVIYRATCKKKRHHRREEF